MAADPDRVPRRRIIDAGAAADECVAGPVRHLSDPGLAGRRRGGRPSRWSAGSRRRRLVVRLRLFPRRPLLGRPCVSGRRQDLRLAAAIRSHCAAGRHGGLLGAGSRLGARDLDARGNARAGARGGAHARGVAARPPVQRFPLERLRLCAGLAALVGAGRSAHRHLGPHLPGGRGLCVACRARRRAAPTPDGPGWLQH